MITQNAGSYKRITGTGNIKPVGGTLLGILVASTSSGTIALYDSATTTTTAPITGTLTPAAGTFIPIPLQFINGFVCGGGRHLGRNADLCLTPI